VELVKGYDMFLDLIVVDPDEDAGDALDKLRERDIRQSPVLRGKEMVGLLRRRDLIKWLQLHSDAVTD
jgi:CBS domain-containing protein